MSIKTKKKIIWEMYGYLALFIVFINLFFKINNNTQGKIWLSYGLLAIAINLILRLNN